MTTIAYDGTTIAADTLSTYDMERCAVPKKKIRVENGVVFALTGAGRFYDALVKWFFDGADTENMPKGKSGDYGYSLIVIDEDGVRSYNDDCGYPNWFKEQKMAWGTGQDYAMGAMYAGADAESAVKVACMLDIKSGGAVQVVNVEQLVRRQAA